MLDKISFVKYTNFTNFTTVKKYIYIYQFVACYVYELLDIISTTID